MFKYQLKTNLNGTWLEHPGFSGTETFTGADLRKGDGVAATFKCGPWSAVILNTYVVQLELTINVPEGLVLYEVWKKLHIETWQNTSYKFARLLLDPTVGDVTFVVRNGSRLLGRLYAYKSILAANNEYFAKRFKTPTALIEPAHEQYSSPHDPAEAGESSPSI
jgi:hypothetical protein